MTILKLLFNTKHLSPPVILSRKISTIKALPQNSNKFETVFSLPAIKYFALINRLKVYHFIGMGIVLPSSGLLEALNVVPNNIFLITSYIGLTSAALLSLVSLPFKNIIGFLYINEDNSLIKISSVDFWGKRKDRVITVDEWIPLLDMPPKTMDGLYLTPQLTDGTKYKLLIKFGRVLNNQKMGEVLE